MEDPAINTTRGVPFDPAASVAHRERQEARNRREQKASVERQIASLSPRKAHAIYLDQVEHAYRERARDRRSSS